MLEKEGCSVHTVTNTLLSVPHDRLVVLADEPTGALDFKTTQEVMDMLRAVNRMGLPGGNGFFLEHS